MSRASKVTLTLSCGVTAGIIAFVQYAQIKERGDRRVVVERQLRESEERRLMNILELQQQQHLTEELRRLEQEEMMKH